MPLNSAEISSCSSAKRLHSHKLDPVLGSKSSHKCAKSARQALLFAAKEGAQKGSHTKCCHMTPSTGVIDLQITQPSGKSFRPSTISILDDGIVNLIDGCQTFGIKQRCSH